MNNQSFSKLIEFFRENKQMTKKDLAVKAGVSAGYISHLARGARTSPSSDAVKALAQALDLNESETAQLFFAAGHVPYPFVTVASIVHDASFSGEDGIAQRRPDWGEAPTVQVFYGRDKELAMLQTCIVEERCQLIAVIGLGGIGKTVLTVRAAELVQKQFEYVFWRSLQNTPTLESFLEDCFQFFIDEQPRKSSMTSNQLIQRLLAHFREHRCLLILDNFESLLQGKHRVGSYISGYEGYGNLLRQLGSIKHESCVLLTSREKPQEFVPLENESGPVRVMRLHGVNYAEAQLILDSRGLHGSTEEFIELNKTYSGNPLALKLISEYIREVFRGDIKEFLLAMKPHLYDIQTLINEQFDRLQRLEKDIVYWLAIAHESMSLNDLLKVMPSDVGPLIVEALNSLRQRSLVETSETARYYLQQVIQDYVINNFIETINEEIASEHLQFFTSHALLIAQSKEYIRNVQSRLIVQPLLQRLRARYQLAGSEKKLRGLLTVLRVLQEPEARYAAGNILNLLIKLDCDLSNADFSDLPVWQAYLQDITLTGVSFAHSDLKNSVFTDTFGSIFSITLNPEGNILAVGTANSEIRTWSTSSDTPLQTYRGHTDWVRSIAFSPDGRLIASGSEDKTVRLWDVATGQSVQRLVGHKNRVCSVSFSPDGTWLASGSDDHTVIIWNVKTGKNLQTLKGHTHFIHDVSFSPDGRLIASSSEDQTIRLWEAHSGECVGELTGHGRAVHTIAFDTEGTLLASGSEDQTIRIWQMGSNICLRTIQCQSGILSVAFSPDGSLVASGDNDRGVNLWLTQTGEHVRELSGPFSQSGHYSLVHSVAFSPDGTTVASGSEDQTVRLWEVKTGQCIRVLRGHTYWVYATAFSPVDDWIASGGDDQVITIWNVHSGKQALVLPVGSKVRCIAFSPDGTLLASGSDDQEIRLWRLKNRQCIKVFHGHTSWVRSIAFSPSNESLVVSSSEDQTIRFWDIDTGECLRTIHEHEDWVYSTAFSPDGTRLASSSADQTVRLWDVRSGESLHVFKGHTNRVCSVAFSPDGSTLASSSADQTVRLWDVASGEVLQTFSGHTEWIFSVCFSPNGKVLASGGDDRTIRLWDVNSGVGLKVLNGHSSWVYSVAFSADGTLLASGSNDGTTMLWDAASGDHLKTLRRDRPYERMNITGARNLTQSQKEALLALGAIDYASRGGAQDD